MGEALSRAVHELLHAHRRHRSRDLVDRGAGPFGDAAQVGLRIRGEAITYSVKDKKLRVLGREAPLDPIDGKIALRKGEVIDARGVATVLAAPWDELHLLELEPGEHQYRLVIDGVWQDDPQAVKRVPNPYGGFNSVLRVPPRGER